MCEDLRNVSYSSGEMKEASFEYIWAIKESVALLPTFQKTSKEDV